MRCRGVNAFVCIKYTFVRIRIRSTIDDGFGGEYRKIGEAHKLPKIKSV